MTEEQRIEILNNAKEFFKRTIVENHINTGCKKASKLANYNINPFLYKYLALEISISLAPTNLSKPI